MKQLSGNCQVKNQVHCLFTNKHAQQIPFIYQRVDSTIESYFHAYTQ